MKASDLALELGGRLLGDDIDVKTSGLYFMLWPQSIREAKKSSAIIITTLSLAADFLDEIDTSVIVIDDVFFAFNKLKELQRTGIISSLREDKIIHESAQIHKSASVYKAIIGPNVVIGPNSVIGCSAFAPFGEEKCKPLPSLGHVVIEENVHVGALCTIQRGLVGVTGIGKNCLIDDQVHVGHDSSIGDDCIIAAQSALAGFVKVLEGATIGGQVGIAPFITIGRHSRVSPKSGVRKNVKDYEIVSGNPGIPHMQYLKIEAKKKH